MTRPLTDARAPYFARTLRLPSGDKIELYASLDGPALRIAYDDGRRIGAVDLDRRDLTLFYQALGDMLDWLGDREATAERPPRARSARNSRLALDRAPAHPYRANLPENASSEASR